MCVSVCFSVCKSVFVSEEEILFATYECACVFMCVKVCVCMGYICHSICRRERMCVKVS